MPLHGPVERRKHVLILRVQCRSLCRPNEDGIAEEQIANPLFAEYTRDPANHFIKAGERSQRIQGGAVSGVLPADRGNLSERRGGHVGRGRGAVDLMDRTEPSLRSSTNAAKSNNDIRQTRSDI